MQKPLKQKTYRAGGYIRVSTEEQAENPEGSIRNQEDRIRRKLEEKNQDGPWGELAALYIDRGKSGKDTNRAEFQKLIRAIRNHEIDLVIVTEISRLSRSLKDFTELWELMQESGCELLSLREQFDSSTAAGEMMLYSIMNFSQFERRQVQERVTANLTARAARGLYNGGPVPVGYKLIEGKPGYLAIEEDQAEIVRQAFHAFIKEGSLSLAAKWMNEQGYRLKRKTQGGGAASRLGHFTVDNIQHIIRNKAYAGIKVYGKRGERKEVKAVWEPIIERVFFDRVQEMLTKNRKTHIKPESFKVHPYLLSGLIRCETCGSSMCGKSAHGNGGKIAYYEHGWLTKRNGCLVKKAFSCDPFRVLAKRLEPRIWDEVKLLLQDDKLQQALIDRAVAKTNRPKEKTERERLKKRVQDVKSQLEALAERLSQLPKGVPAEPIFKQMQKLEAMRIEEEQRLNAVMIDANSENAVMPVDLRRYQKFIKALLGGGIAEIEEMPQEKAKIIHSLIDRIEIGKDRIRVHYHAGEHHFNGEQVKTCSRLFLCPKSEPGEKSEGDLPQGLEKSGVMKWEPGWGSRSLTNGWSDRD